MAPGMASRHSLCSHILLAYIASPSELTQHALIISQASPYDREQGAVLETSITHEAAIIVERRTLNRCAGGALEHALHCVPRSGWRWLVMPCPSCGDMSDLAFKQVGASAQAVLLWALLKPT
jgi:hypothetical protein